VKAIGDSIVLVTMQLPTTPIYACESTVNSFIRSEGARFPNVHVADWNTLSDTVPGVVGGDGTHLTRKGRTAYAELAVGAAC
jgi:hypothetical protein